MFSDAPDASPPSTPPAACVSVMSRFHEAQSGHPGRSRLARIFGRDPLLPDARPWFVGALGEIDVAHRLRVLQASGGSWRVLHSVPVEPGTAVVEPATAVIEPATAVIDHVVIGPAGVFAVTTAHHPGQRLVVESGTLTVEGRELPALPKVRAQAARASSLLEGAVGHPVPVRPLVVVVGASPRTRKRRPDGVGVIEAGGLVRHLRSLPAGQSIDDVRDVTRAALQPRTWRARGAKAQADPRATGSQSTDAAGPARDILIWFAGVRAEVRRAQRVRLAWGSAAVLGALAAVDALVVELPRILTI